TRDSDRIFIRNNTIANNSGVGVYFYDVGSVEPTPNRIEGNVISGNAGGGIWAERRIPPEAHFNNIFGNAGFGVKLTETFRSLNATDNWWGCATGPNTTGCDPAITDGKPGPDGNATIDYTPWLTAPNAFAGSRVGLPTCMPLLVCDR
ncbi:MAG TPA: right-handed parallel beta-helix repeat-containing protein, partial [Candidatus Thermoplasmatota archaeon]|nr:right-handed parallel beta-helix repeat-containing protein [Candidatus Thermoplasmatota archaeon]